MSTPQRLANAVENYFGPHDPEVKAEILAALDAHFRSPWIFNQDAQPDADAQVICLDPDEQGRPAGPVTICARSPEDDWTLPEFVFWWMHVPPLPEGGLLSGQESPETRVDIGHEDGHQQLPEDGALANKIAAIMQQWAGTNGGVYAIRGCAMEIARELQGATTSGDEQAAFTTWAEVEYRNEASYTARDYRMGLEAWRRRALVDRSPNLQSSAVDESSDLQSHDQRNGPGELAEEIDGLLLEVANGERKASEMPLTTLLRAVSVLRAMAGCIEDAERYRFIRDGEQDVWCSSGDDLLTHAQLDSAIDAARQKEA